MAGVAVPAACTAQFTGQAGALFAHALSAVMAAHCAWKDPMLWPEDDAFDILRTGGGRYDFIVVGAGTAGSLVANRLGQVAGWNVLLIEAGDDPTLDSEVPAFLFCNQNTEQDWQHKTSKNPNHCLASTDGACRWAKGRGMGGSTSINAMLYVRGNRADYDAWAAAGNPGWDYDNVLPYFKKTEDFSEINHVKNASFYHATAGELHVEPYGEPKNPWIHVITNAWKELGYIYNEDINGKSQIGVSNVQGSVKDGTRYNTAKRLLSDAKRRGNLHVMKNTIVTRVIIDQTTKIATGVEVRHRDGAVMEIKATKEVILSAGTIKTPQILMLSGIGPRQHLEDMNIIPIVDLPVGKNLHDHPIIPVLVQIPEDKSRNITDEEVTLFILQYMMTRKGPFRGIGMTDLLGFVDTKDNSEIPDIQFHHIYFSREDKVILPAYRSATGYIDEFWDILAKMNKRNDLVGIYPTLLKPKSRGEILLQSADPLAEPVINANYFDREEDLDTSLRGIDFILKLQETDIFKSIGIKLPHFDLKSCAQASFGSKDYWRCYIRNVASTIYHPVGTCKMAPVSDAGVVDASLRVRSVVGLRVVDASVMPTVPRGNTMAPTLMIAEKAADMVKGFWLARDKIEL